MSVPLTLGIVRLGIDLVISCFAGRSSFSLEDSVGSRSSCRGGCGERLSCILGSAAARVFLTRHPDKRGVGFMDAMAVKRLNA